ncbi:GNAT family N-acetyltransferase [Roseinatronobacter sp. S2]|uniref:GNAT family N-acetyltransferase n=1 Tax=Roseinatronobacter sp. S2 TaxID=3035471 RepID=UPI0024104392|nr:GNAT family N-acetyltransferase [Roseinatronobacter sp. S2]WFE73322.1 GNAT family N-acetyltransferase [Roseinatronobacter sp. S2]
MTLSIALTEDLATCHALRRAVFIEEQGVSVIEEVDGRDTDALHILAHKDGQAVGCARILVAGATGKIGRVCVLAQMRGQGVGVALIEAALDCLRQIDGVTQARLGAQTHAIGFYERLGFSVDGPEYLDAGIVHRDMVRPV